MIENNPTTGLVQVHEPEDGEPEEVVESEEVAETEVIQAVPELPSEGAPKPRRRGLLRRILSRAGFAVWFGLVLTALGFGLIAFTWAKVAALTDVSAQVPYVVSGGLAGLGLILVGLLVVNLAVKRREAEDRRRQLEEVRDALVGLRHSIEGTDVEDEA